MTRRSHVVVPEFPDSDAEIFRGSVSIIIPEETTNLVENPSAEYSLDGYTAINSTIVRTDAQQCRGIFSIGVTPINANEAGVRYNMGTTTGYAYTFSVDLWGRQGDSYALYIAADPAGTRLANSPYKVVRGKGFWERVSITFVESAGATRQFRVVRVAGGSLQQFYVDGVQIENKDHPTTYTDGDQSWLVLDENAYYWHGAAHASASTRIGTTRAGGREMSFLYYGLMVLNVMGLGMAPVANFATPSSLGGSYYQNTITQDRQFSLTVQINKDNHDHLRELRRELISAVQPDATQNDTPLILRFCPRAGQGDRTDLGEPTGEVREIECLYESGLEGNWGNENGERFAITFRAYAPLVRNESSIGKELGYNSYLTGINSILHRSDATGIWDNMAGGVVGPGGINGAVDSILRGNNGTLYVGGWFANAGGDALADYFAKWSGTAFSNATPLGASDNWVRKLLTRSDGLMYVGGSFTSINGVAVGGLALFDPVTETWVAMGAGVTGGAAPTVADMALAEDGTLYIVGNYTTAGGVACNGLAAYNPATGVYSAVGAFAGPGAGSMISVAVGKDGTIYVSHSRVDAGGVVWQYKGGTWTAILTGYMVGALTPSATIRMGDDGYLYAAGVLFSYNRLARWNGVKWTTVGGGLGNNSDASNAPYKIVNDITGTVWVVGAMTVAGADQHALPDGLVYLGGDYLYHEDIDLLPWLAANPYVREVYRDWNGDLYVGFFHVSAAQARVGKTTVNNTSGSKASPKIIIDGPGRLFKITNQRTGQVLIFKDLVIQPFERVVLDLDPARISFISNLRGDMGKYVGEGTDYDFCLLDGTNDLWILMDRNWYEVNDNNNQISDYNLTGLTSGLTTGGWVFLTITDDGAGFFHVDFYSDPARAIQIGSIASTNVTGLQTVLPAGGSGLGGEITIGAWVAADADIQVAFGFVYVEWQPQAWSVD